MINFLIPGFYENFKLNVKLLDVLKDYPYYFYDGVRIEAVYGSFPFNIWDGGRTFPVYRHATREEIEKIKHIFNDIYDVNIRQVMTNPVIQEDNFYNRFGNICLSLCENERNEVIINNSDFEEFVREHYPQYKFISSTTKCLNTVESFKNELDNPNYRMICLDYNLNHNWKMLEQLTDEQKKKCEFLINAICPPGCPDRKNHYKNNGKFALSFGKHYAMTKCGVAANTCSWTTRNYHNNISPTELYEKYAPMGFEYFKIEGRTLPSVEIAANYCYYMVKPEYHDEVLLKLCEDDFMTKAFTQTFTLPREEELLK